MLNLLLVDDDSGSRKIIEQALELFPEVSVVGSVESGMEAISFIRKNPVDLVFLDIEMEEMNGFEVAAYLHSHYPNIQYVFVTGHSDFALEGYNYQPLSFLVKPISVSRLEQVLNLAAEKAQKKQLHRWHSEKPEPSR